MMALNRYRLHHLAKKSRAAHRAEKLLKRPDRLLSAILIGNTLATVLASSLTTLIAQHYFGAWGVFAVTLLLTLIILLFGEIIPKTLAAVKPETLALPAALPLKGLIIVLSPLIFLLTRLTNAILKRFGISISDQHTVDPLTSEELRTAVSASRDALAEPHKNMLLGVLDLEKETVKGAMLPRQNIRGLNLNEAWPDILRQLQESPFSKLPVYRDSMDDVIGILPLRKIVSLSQEMANPQAVLEKLVDPPYFIPETTTLQYQLIRFQQHSEHMAFVVDEYGDIQGLVTVQDILEEIVGRFTNISQPSLHIYTEHLEDGSFLVDGAMTLRDLNRDLNLDLPTDGPRTLSGLIVEYLEAMPVAGVSLKMNEYPIEVIEVEDNAVKTAKINLKLNREENQE